ncbi:MAG TPA: DUF192 domain-containing protein [Rickettsiales bacterium]|nr:DUF192 domain-containing protein [Rickettsiales bacterium]
MKKIYKTLLLAVFLLECTSAVAAPLFPAGHVTIITSRAHIPLTVEVATNEEQMRQGLMFRESLPKGHGMLFKFPEAQATAMWMKNTLIPLDMLFINDKQVVSHIVKNATPGSIAPIPSGGPVQYILEINGGAVDEYHIAEGDRIILK